MVLFQRWLNIIRIVECMCLLNHGEKSRGHLRTLRPLCQAAAKHRALTQIRSRYTLIGLADAVYFVFTVYTYVKVVYNVTRKDTHRS